VALKLKITPHVNDSDMVRLEIEQEISDIASENFANLGPSWTKRTVKTTVVVKDQQPVVIGGLMQDKTLINQSKVPLLGDIPILGYFFKFERKTKTKTNLLIFLTPYVIKDQGDIRTIFQKKVRERREFLRAYSSFTDEGDYEPEVDYNRKTGLVEDINQTVLRVEEDEAMLRQAEQSRGGDEDGPVQVPDDFVPPEDAPEAPPQPPPPAESLDPPPTPAPAPPKKAPKQRKVD
jgi:general secretion pathway protein D